MKFTLILFCIIFLVPSTIFTQKQTDPIIDSLEVCLVNTNITALEKINLHLNLAKRYRRTNSNQQKKHAENAIKIAGEQNNLEKKAQAFRELGLYYKTENKNDSAYYCYAIAINELTVLQDDRGVAVALMSLSNLQKSEGKYGQAVSSLIHADSLFKLVKDTSGSLAIYVNIGVIFGGQKDYETALIYFKNAEDIVGENLSFKSAIYTNLSAIYGELRDNENAYKYVVLLIEIKKKLGDIIGLSNAYNNLSALIIAEKGVNVESINLLEKALEGYKQANYFDGIIISYNNLGDIYKMRKEYVKAENYFLKAQLLLENTQNHGGKLSNEKNLYQLYAEIKSWKKAFIHLKAFNALNDSIIEIEKIKIIKELQTKYETNKVTQEKELAEVNEFLAEERAEKSEKLSYGVFFIGGLILIITFFAYDRFRNRKKQELLSVQLKATQQELVLENKTRKSELKALQSQMNPHFIFNALNSIQDLILLQDIRNSNKYLGMFSDLIRKILAASNKGLISIKEEVEMLEIYAELEKFRFGKELKLTLENKLTDQKGDEFLIPAMFIQPYIENAFKHGLLHKMSGVKTLDISFFLEKNFIVCKIDDNGVGREKSAEIKKRRENIHLGFSSTANSQRIDLINTNKVKKITLNIIDKVEKGVAMGTTVIIRFPIHEL